MKIVMIGAVEEGWIVFNEVLKNKDYTDSVVGIITIDEEDTSKISGYRSFDGLAEAYNKPFYKIKHIRTPEAYDLIKSLEPDLIMVMGWSQLVGDDVLALPKLGSIGLHTTLLPRHRGRAPVPWAIIKQLGRSGNTLFYFTPGVDNGDIIAQKHFYITLDDTAQTVYDKATQAGVDLVMEFLPAIKNGTAPRIKQDESISDHWPKRRPKDGLINWESDALDVHNLIRAVTHPYPGAFTYLNGRKLFIWESHLLGTEELGFEISPGKIHDIAYYENGFVAGTGKGAILISRVQLDGEEEMSGYDFIGNFSIAIGSVFGNE